MKTEEFSNVVVVAARVVEFYTFFLKKKKKFQMGMMSKFPKWGCMNLMLIVNQPEPVKEAQNPASPLARV